MVCFLTHGICSCLFLVVAPSVAEGLSLVRPRALETKAGEEEPSRGQLYTVTPSCGNDTAMDRLTDVVLTAANKPPSQSNNSMFPEWIQRFCPHVVDHFTDFPYFPGTHASPLPVFTTVKAAHSACSIQLAVHMASALGFEIGLHAGSALGALLHGGPIPWDDDVDMLIPHSKRAQFIDFCNKVGEVHPGARVECKDGFNSIKLAVVTSDSAEVWDNPYAWIVSRAKVSMRHEGRDWSWHWPFLDIFTFDVKDGRVRELGPSGDPQEWSAPTSTYYPTKSWYFAGVLVSGLQDQAVMDRYDLNKCVLAEFDHEMGWSSAIRPGWLGSNFVNHAVSLGIPTDLAEWLAAKIRMGLALDCCRLAARFPFGYNSTVLSNGNTSRDMSQLRGRAQRGAATSARLFAPMLAGAGAEASAI